MLAHHLLSTDMADLLLALSKPTPPLFYLLYVELFLSSSGVQLLYWSVSVGPTPIVQYSWIEERQGNKSKSLDESPDGGLVATYRGWGSMKGKGSYFKVTHNSFWSYLLSTVTHVHCSVTCLGPADDISRGNKIIIKPGIE